MRTIGTITLCLLFLATSSVVLAEEPVEKVDKRVAKRAAIDRMARETLQQLLSENPAASRAADNAAGYAVFDSFKAAFLVSGGGGVGVAVDSSTGQRTYMKMGTAGIGLGLGGRRRRPVAGHGARRVVEPLGFLAVGEGAVVAALEVAGGLPRRLSGALEPLRMSACGGTATL